MARFESATDDRTITKENSATRMNDLAHLADAVDSLWHEFASAGSLEAFCGKWLALQCRMIDGVSAGVVLVAPDENRPFIPAAFWPDRNQDLKHLREVAERALAEGRGLVVKRLNPDGDLSRLAYVVAYPIQSAARVYAVFVMDVDSRPEEALRGVVRQLQWGSAWMEVLFHRSREAQQPAQTTSPNHHPDLVLSLLAVLVSQE